MSILSDRQWKLKYTPDDGDLVHKLYLPALECAVSYDRLTGYFSASALALAARGVERMVANGGRMCLVVGCTLDPPEVAAIEKGESLKARVEQHIAANPLAPRPGDQAAIDALELLAWMVAQGILEVKVGVPCDDKRRPIAAEGIFHEKAGIVADKTGDRIAFNGSLNETEAGWLRNWESLNVFTSWSDGPRVDEEEASFARIWANQAKFVITLDVPAAVRDDLLRFLPKSDKPARIKNPPPAAEPPEAPPQFIPPPAPAPLADLRRLVWGYIHHAPAMPNGGERVGEATCAVTPWPHQVRAFHKLYDRWPPRLLIADEVGLGKTIQAGLLLRQAVLAGRAKRVLVLAPKNICRQWQIELREKFNLNWPIYDGQSLTWYPSPAMAGRHVKATDPASWHKQPAVIASSHLMRRHDRAPELLEQAARWDLIVLDEAHHARRRAAGTANEDRPNALLRLMRGLAAKTDGLVLLTATPMQVHPIEVWDLLRLLGLPPEWSATAFLRFFEQMEAPSPSHEAFEELAAMFRAVERHFGPVPVAEAIRLGAAGRLSAGRVLGALRDGASIPRRQLAADERRLALSIMRLNTPIGRLVSRHTRELLRRYYKAGKLSTPIADRKVEDRFIEMSSAERELYDAVEDYISTTYNQSAAKERSAVGFVMTIYRRRLASSFRALGETLSAHLDAISTGNTVRLDNQAEDDVDDPDATGEAMDADEVADLARAALLSEERDDIRVLLGRIRALPADSKTRQLRAALADLRGDGYTQAMVFTQYTDTMDFLRQELRQAGDLRIMCFSGRGGEVPNPDGTWHRISRDDTKRRFRQGQADILLCTDAAAEGLNFQFCGAMINYDMPWNPMRVEQRIGRIDRLGQNNPIIRVVNLHYADTIESDIYMVLRNRIGLFESVVGRMQPILAHLPGLISNRVLAGRGRSAADRASAANEIETEAAEAQRGGFDIGAVTEADLTEPARPPPRLNLDDLEAVIGRAALLPPGIDIKTMQAREYRLLAPGMASAVRVTTDAEYYEQHADSVELWSPGSPIFVEPEVVATAEELPPSVSIGQLLRTGAVS